MSHGNAWGGLVPRRPLAASTRPGRRIIAADPGLLRLMAGWRSLVSVTVGVVIGLLGASWFGEPAIVGLSIGGLMGFITAIGVSDNTARGISRRCGAAIVPFMVGFSLSLALHPYRWACLVMMVVLLFVHMYSSQFGPYGHDFGTVLFATFLSGMLLPLSMGSFVPLTVVAALSLAAVTVARLLLCTIRPGKPLAYAEAAFFTRFGAALDSAERILREGAGAAPEKKLRRLRTRVHHLNESALLADACLATLPAATAERAHRLIFDTEQATQRLVRVVEALIRADAPLPVRAAAAEAIREIRDRPNTVSGGGRELLDQWLEDQAEHGGRASDAVVLQVYLLLALCEEYAELADAWRGSRSWGESSPGESSPFRSAVPLLAGKLPGATLLGRRAVRDGADDRWSRWKMSQHLRTAIQAAIAVAIVTPLADLIDPDRFYWGAIGVLIMLAGTTSTHDRLRKLGQRLAGTVLGGAAGLLVTHLLGTTHPVVSCVVAILALAVGGYSLGTYYGVWVFGLVLALCQVYNVVQPVTDTLLVYRLGENVLGAVIAILVALFVLPLSTKSIIRYGVRHYFTAVRDLLTDTAGQFDVQKDDERLRHDARSVDSGTYELDRVLDSVLPVSHQSRRTTDNLRLWLVDLTHNGRELAKTAASGDVPMEWRQQLVDLVNTVAESVDRLASVTDATPRATEPWHRQSVAIDAVLVKVVDEPGPAADRLRHALHHLGVIDDTIANWANAAGYRVLGAPYSDLALKRQGTIPVATLHQRLVTVHSR